MALDPKYGYTRIGSKIFTTGGQIVPTPLDSHGEDETAAQRCARDRDYLFGRFGWFWSMRGKILESPEIYKIYPLFAGLSLAYIGGGPLSLGMLFRLWSEGLWAAPCPECGGKAFIYFAGGSPLSGMNRWTAHCMGCGANVTGSAQKFHELWRPAKALIDEAAHKNRVSEKEAPPREQKPRADFREMSRRWRSDYDEKSEEELERKASERKAQREAERLRALEKERKRLELLGLTPGALPTETAAAMLEKRRSNIHAHTQENNMG